MFNRDTVYTPLELQEMWDEEKRRLAEALESKKEIAGRIIQGGSALLPLLKISPQVRGISTLASIGNGLIKQASQKMTPYVGRKIAELSTKGAVLGSLTGGVEGLGRGMAENRNPLKTTIQDAVIGGVSGLSGGALAGKVITENRRKILDELLDKKKDWGIAFRKQSGKPDAAIEKLLEQKQGFVPNAVKKKGVGEIDFVWGEGGKKGYGFSHIIDQRNAQGINAEKFVKDIPNILIKGEKRDVSNQPNIKFFKENDNNVLVKKVWDDKKRNWIVTAFKDKESLNKPTNRTPDIVNIKDEMAPSSSLNKDTKIIPPPPSNLNSAEQNVKSGRKPNPYPLGSKEYWQEEARRARFW